MLIFEEELDGLPRPEELELDTVLRDVRIESDPIWHHGPEGPTEWRDIKVTIAGCTTLRDALSKWTEAQEQDAEAFGATARSYFIDVISDTVPEPDDGTLVLYLALGT